MNQNKNRDNEFFNCSQEHEVDYVAKQYRDPEAVKKFITEKCREKVISYWTHKQLYEYLAESNFVKK